MYMNCFPLNKIKMKTENTRIKTIKSPPLTLPKCAEHHQKTTKKPQNKSQTNKKQTKQPNKKKHQKKPQPQCPNLLALQLWR